MSAQKRQAGSRDGSVPGEGRVLAVGSLSTATRTVAGALVQSEWFGCDQRTLHSILRRCGLPDRAVQEPDFLISMDQELTFCLSLLEIRRDPGSVMRFIIERASALDITVFGVPGLTMLHAPSFLEAQQVYFDFPQLFWGHSRMMVMAGEEATLVRMSFKPPPRVSAPADKLADLALYCLVRELCSIAAINDQIMGADAQVAALHVPFDPPQDELQIRNAIPWPIRFGTEFAQFVLPPQAVDAVPVRAQPLFYRGNLAVCRELARLRPVESPVADQAMRWLWAHEPPLSRGELATRLGLSERSLARRLKSDGTSYNQLYAKVQSERAANLLRNPGLSIAEIGYRLGYADPAAFTRAFQGWTGQTPSAWRAGHGRSGAIKGR